MHVRMSPHKDRLTITGVLAMAINNKQQQNVCLSASLPFLLIAFFANGNGFELPTPALLSNDYYARSCPVAVDIVKQEMTLAVLKEARMAASILRLHFHDCFVQGCDASVLLDDTPTFRGEKTANANANSLRGYEVIDGIKERLESVCPGVVSCADILTLAARDAVVLAGGPYWDVALGRKDSMSASVEAANQQIPASNASLPNLISKFMLHRLTVTDMVALAGAHTIGQARCTSFRDRLYKDAAAAAASSSMFAEQLHTSLLKSVCPESGGDEEVWPLDTPTPTLFDNSYFMQLINGQGLLQSDQIMYEAELDSIVTAGLVRSYAYDYAAFAKQFSDSMVKMGNILDPAVFASGQIRTNCRKINT